jgi:hypothetical protein
MQIVARLEESTLRELLGELLPVTILLDDEGMAGRWIAIEPATTVDFVAGEGLRLVTSGRVHWVAGGVPLDATLQAAHLLLRPEVVADKHGGRLVFRPSLEEADLKNVPALLDRGITALINRQLEARGEQIAWDFGSTLAFSVQMPPALSGVQALRLSVINGQVTVTDHAIEMTLQLSLQFTRSPAPRAT